MHPQDRDLVSFLGKIMPLRIGRDLLVSLVKVYHCPLLDMLHADIVRKILRVSELVIKTPVWQCSRHFHYDREVDSH